MKIDRGVDHTIDYVVTGHSGLTSTTTRTVIVSAAANDNQSDEPGTEEPVIAPAEIDATAAPAVFEVPAAEPANDNQPTVELGATGTE